MKCLKLLLFCGLVLQVSQAMVAQNTLYMNPIKYTDRNLNSYHDNCSDAAKLHYWVNNGEIARTTVYYCCGFHSFSIDYGLMKPGDVFKVTQDCSPNVYSQVVKDDYVYVEVPNGLSYTGNGISATDETAPYSKLSTPLSVGKCETITLNAHGLSEYFIAYYPPNSGLTTGLFSVNAVPLTSGASVVSPAGHTLSSQGVPNVTSTVNTNGSITSNGSFKLTSNTALSGTTPIHIEYQHNGISVGGDFAFGFGAMFFKAITNTGFKVAKSSTAGVATETFFTGNYANALLKITYDGTYYRAYLNGVKIDELRRFVKYASSSGTLSLTTPQNYGTGVTWIPSSAGSQWVSTEVDGILYTRQQFTVADDMVLTGSSTNVGCFGGNTGSIATNITSGKSPFTYSLNGGAFETASTFNNLSAGTYTVQAKDASGCTITKNFTISQYAVLEVRATKTDITCWGQRDGSVTLTASAGAGNYTYSTDGTNYGTSNTFSGLPAGTKTFYVKDGAGCLKTVNATIGTQSTIMANISNQTNVTCFGGNTGWVSIGTTGSAPSGTLQYSVGGAFQTTPTFTGLTANAYTITVKDNLCQVTFPLTIIQPADLVVSPTINKQISCNGLTDGQITVGVSGGIGTYQYSRDNITFVTPSVFSSLAANSYKFWVKDANACVKNSGIYTIIEPTAMSLSVASKVDVTCNGASTGSITLSASGGTNTSTYSKDGTNFQASNIFSNLSAGAYTLTVKDANGCTKTVNTSILEQTAMVLSQNITHQISCFGGSDGEVTLSATGGAGAYQFSKDNVTYLTTAVFAGLNAGTYTFYSKDVNGCIKTVSVTLGEPPLLVPSIATQSNVLCKSGSDGAVNLGATGGTSPCQYSKDGTSFQGTIGFSGFTAGTYSFTIKDAKGCVKTINATITEPTLLVATASTTQQVSCFGGNNGTIQVNGSGGTNPYQYSNNGATYVTTNSFSGLTIGSYSYWVKDANGCVKTTASTLVTQPTDIFISLSTKSDVKCFGGNDGSLSVTASGGTGTLTYSKDGTNFQSSNSFTNLTAQTYTISVKDQNACIRTFSIQILQPTAFTVSSVSTQNLSCFGNNTGRIEVVGTGGTSNYQYSINNSIFQNLTVFSGLGAGTYTVYAKDANNCLFNLANNTVNQPSDITVSLLEKVDVDCDYYQKGSFKVGASGGVGSFAYNLSGQDLKFNPIAGQSNASGVFTDLFAGNYVMNVQDVTGCVKPFPVTIVPKNSHITFNIVKTVPTTCSNADGFIIINSVGGGRNPYQYRLSTQNVFTNSNIFNNLGNGSYIITVADGLCAYNQSVDLSLPTSLKATYTISPISCGVPNGNLTVTGITGGNGNYSFSLDGTNFSNNTIFNNLTPNVYALTLKDSPLSCQSVVSFELKEQNRADLTLNGKTDILCNGASTGAITMMGNNNVGPFSYALNQKNSFVASGTFTGLRATTHKVYAKTSLGCLDSLRVTLSQPTAITGQVTQKNNDCFGDNTAHLDASASGGVSPYTYSMDGTNYGTSSAFTALKAGNYTLSIKDANACVLPKNVTIVQPTVVVPASSIGQNVSCFGGTDGSVMVSGTGGTSPYQFSNDQVNFTTRTTFGNLGINSYTYWVKDAHGCTQQTSPITVTQPTLLVPSVSSIGNINCFGGNDGSIDLLATGGVSPYQYSSEPNNFGNQPHLSGFVAGSYTLYLKDAHGCVKQTQQDLSQPRILTVGSSVGKNVSCFGGNDGELVTTSEGGVSPYQYALDEVSFKDSPNFKELKAKRFIITVKDAHNCVQKTSIIGITEPPLLVPTVISQTDVLCFGGSDGKINTNASGGTSPYLYALDGTTFQTTQRFTGLKKQGYVLSVKDGKGCLKTLDVTINQPSDLLLTAIYQDTIPCFKDAKGVAMLKVGGGTSGYVFSKNGSDYVTDSTFQHLTAGEYQFYVKDANQCQKQVKLQLTEPTQLNLSLVKASDPLCTGDANGKIELLATGGNLGYTYLLDNAQKKTEGLFTDLADNEYALQVIDKKGCKQNITPVKLTNPKPLSADVSLEDPKCVGDNNGKITLKVVGGNFPYTAKNLSDSVTFKEVQVFEKLRAGTYQYSVNDKNGCKLSLPVKLAEPQVLNPIVFDAPKEVCKEQVVTLDAKNPDKIIQWYRNGKELSKKQKIDISEPDEYSVSVKNASGCEVLGKYTLVNNKNALKVDFLMAVQAFVGDTVVALDITSPKPDEIQWKLPSEAYTLEDNAQKLSFILSNIGDYEISQLAKKGDCRNTKTRTIKIFKREDVDNTDPKLGYKNLVKIQKMDVSPNPNYGAFAVNVELSIVGDAELTITRSTNMAVVYQDKATGEKDHKFQVQLKNAPQGIYIVTIRAGALTLTKKVLVLN